MFDELIPDFSGCRPVPPRKALKCGYAGERPGTACLLPASWHVLWYVRGGRGAFMLLCETHMELARVKHVYTDCHRAAVACDSPGFLWHFGDPSFCFVPGEEAEQSAVRHDDLVHH